jgi:ADP-ribose pyrophosphatase
MKTTLCAGKFLALVQEGHWEYAVRSNATGAAIIVAVTDREELILVEQYRIPVHCWTVELPAGIVGDEPGGSDEGHLEAANRELLEETGYTAAAMQELSTGASSAGLTSELVTFFLATGLRREQDGGGVAHEKITVHAVPLKEIVGWLAAKAKAGVLVDPKIYAGLYLLKVRKRN